MINKLLFPSAFLVTFFSLTGYGQTSATPISPESPTISLEKQAGKKLAPGTYCYSAKTKTLDADAKITISSGNAVKGTVRAAIQNPAEGYFSSYIQTLTGKLVGDKATLQIVTKIENDTQNTKETWTITSNTLNTGRETFTKINCATLNDGEQATPTRKPVRIKFAPGATSATVKNSVIRGERDNYLLGVKKGQQMSVKITSLEKNAVFDVVAPNGSIIKQEATNWSGKLTQAGDYKIVVGGTRGNATYQLTVTIK